MGLVLARHPWFVKLGPCGAHSVDPTSHSVASALRPGRLAQLHCCIAFCANSPHLSPPDYCAEHAITCRWQMGRPMGHCIGWFDGYTFMFLSSSLPPPSISLGDGDMTLSSLGQPGDSPPSSNSLPTFSYHLHLAVEWSMQSSVP